MNLAACMDSPIQVNPAFDFDPPARDLRAIKRAIANKLRFSVGKDPLSARPEDWFRASAYAIRDHLIDRWMQTTRAQYAQDSKRVYYLSMEFLIGRSFSNALLALGLRDRVSEALAEMGVDLEQLLAMENDAALGNGGLGRLAACFLDAMATLNVPGFGYGIRYDYGMFRQKIVDGQQQEAPDQWLKHGHPWEFVRAEVSYRVHFGGRVMADGSARRWVDTEPVKAVAHDIIVPGYDTLATNTLRLWSARADEEIDLAAFNRGNYMEAVAKKNLSENVSRVLYPDDSTDPGRRLRLQQEYFFVSASVQDLLRRYLSTHDDLRRLSDKICIHLNDTHPVLAVPELMRLLVDVHRIDWDAAWTHCQRIFSYTNHTLMSEALETWPVAMLADVLPRHLEIIFDLNAQFLATLSAQGCDGDMVRRMSLISEEGDRRVRMAYLAVLASYSVNGVSKLHSRLMTESIFADFYRLWPERFNNKTNGITQRRWLAQANPELSSLVDQRIGTGWRRDLSQMAGMRDFAADARCIEAFLAMKARRKLLLARWIGENLGYRVHPESLFDVQIKRIHEYKRQLLNLLQVIDRYFRILDHPEADWVPRTVIFSGKAASAYAMAKLIIRLIHDVAATIRKDAHIGNRLQVCFIPNYSVSLAELIIPAAELSEQISTAGTEASGTGNMKLALNGALTIGTLDGANIEILESVGADNMFVFGLTAEQVRERRASGYAPARIVEDNPRLRRVLDAVRDGRFSPGEPGRYHAIHDALIRWGDYYLLLADFASYVQAHDDVDRCYRDRNAWAGKSLINIAGTSRFSADRTIAEYVDQIWRCPPVRLQSLHPAG